MADLNRFQVAGLTAYLAGRRRIALRAGWGTGKSHLLAWIARLAGEQQCPALWVTDTGPHIDTIIQPAAEKLLAPAGWRYIGDKRCWVKNGVPIWLRSYFRPSTKAAESNSAEGSNVGIVLLDECQMWTSDEPLKKLFGRARIGPIPPAIVMAGLPVYNAWWEDAARAMGSRGAIVHGTSFDNRGILKPEWFEDALDTLGQAEFEAMLLNKPRPPAGQVYDSWSPDPHPAGNVIHGWRYDRSMFTVLAIDFGRYNPAVLVLAKDPRYGWVICGEVNPRSDYTKTPELARLILQVAWPRYLEHMAPVGEHAPQFFFDDVVGDPAGGQRRADARTGDLEDSDLEILGEMPEGIGPAGHQGIGYKPRVLTGHGDDYIDRRNPRSGILRVHRAFGRRDVLCTAEVYERGRRVQGKERSFARSVVGFRYGANGEPVRTEGHDHILDALRFFVRDDVSGLWGFHPTVGRGIGITETYTEPCAFADRW